MEDNFKDIAEEALIKGIDRFEYITRLQKFHDEHCCSCDNELCYDIYDEHGRDVCELYNKEFNL